jgi:hypothetical protein
MITACSAHLWRGPVESITRSWWQGVGPEELEPSRNILQAFIHGHYELCALGGRSSMQYNRSLRPADQSWDFHLGWQEVIGEIKEC